MKWTEEAEERFEELHSEVATSGDGADFVFSFEATVHKSLSEPAAAHSVTVFRGETCYEVEFYRRSVPGGIQFFFLNYAINQSAERVIVWFTRGSVWH